MNRTYTTSCLALLTVGLAAAPASAGGILPIASPAFGNSCANHGTPHASGTTTHGPGAANGNLAGLPVSNPANQCGGADATPTPLAFLYLIRP
ncbi:chaplin family protein [Streptomyces sp. ISL-11]|uniref:chaplin family protein n=1 Tax=Streptomyces sp. ISL-11 TaxID=2819174 RepID=UPI001BE84178|nr:chaplin family protein [Streptomyces sp. ISL-11]MBT2386457.1 chaplin [Streptomyces sp. ISL-11]